jgi:hypothetical protein
MLLPIVRMLSILLLRIQLQTEKEIICFLTLSLMQLERSGKPQAKEGRARRGVLP